MRTVALIVWVALAGLTGAACSEDSHSSTDEHNRDAAVPTDAGGGSPDAASSPSSDAGEASLDGGAPEPSDAGTPLEEDAGVPDAPEWRSELTQLSDFVDLASAGTELKFLLARDASALPEPLEHACYFQNTELFPYHLQFLRSFSGLEQLSNPVYEEWALWRNTRKLYTGVLRLLPNATHPTSARLGVLAYAAYTAQAPDELLKTDELIAVYDRLRRCTGPLAELLVYVPLSNAELDAALASAEALSDAGMAFAAPNQLSPNPDTETYSEGEAYGFLRRLPSAEASHGVGPRDVLMTESAPNELGIVAALITEKSQSSVSHLNLRLREKSIPNVAAPKWFESKLIDQMLGQLVRVRAAAGEVLLEPADIEDAETFWASQRGESRTPSSDLAVDAIATLSSLRHLDALSYGVKAANLGELSRALPDGNHLAGLAIPFAAYLQHIEAGQLTPSVTRVIELAAPGGAQGRAALNELRDAIRAAPIVPAWEQAFHDAVLDQWGEAGLTTRLRFRSSTNVEDLAGLSGAGLYESVSGCIADDLDDDDEGPSACLSTQQRDYYEAELELRRAEYLDHPDRTHLPELVADLQDELSKEKSARRALRKVWASLWNERAFEDRQYHAIEHSAAFMAIAVHPALVGEQLEAVAITELASPSSNPSYRVTSQVGEVGVAQPSDPSAVAELLSFTRAPDDTVAEVTQLQSSSLAPDGEALWSPARLADLGLLLFAVQDHFAQHVYPDLSPLHLDVEVDVSADGQILVKQARPYSGELAR